MLSITLPTPTNGLNERYIKRAYKVSSKRRGTEVSALTFLIAHARHTLFLRTKIDVRRAARYFRINFMQISKLSKITAIDTNEARARATVSCCLHVNCFERLLGKHGSILITIFPTSRRKKRQRGEPSVLHKYWPKIFRWIAWTIMPCRRLMRWHNVNWKRDAQPICGSGRAGKGHEENNKRYAGPSLSCTYIHTCVRSFF